MEAGRLRHKVTIQRSAETTQSDGTTPASWSTHATGWAEIAPLSGRELFNAQQTQSLVTHRISMRYASGVTAAMRILYGSRVFNIESVIDVEERHAELQLLCVEQTTGAKNA